MPCVPLAVQDPLFSAVFSGGAVAHWLLLLIWRSLHPLAAGLQLSESESPER